MPHTLHTESGKKISVVVSIHKQDQIVYLLPPVSKVFCLMGSHKIIFNSLEWMERGFFFQPAGNMCSFQDNCGACLCPSAHGHS